MQLEEGLQLGQLVPIIRRRLNLVAIVAGGVALASILVAALLPNRYDAAALLLIEPQTISRRLVEAGLDESDIDNRLHLMTAEILSRGRLSRVIDDLGLYEEESREMTREEVIERMRGDIQVEPVLPELTNPLGRRGQDFDISTFRIIYRSDAARTAAAVSNRLANDFIEEQIKRRVEVSGDTSDFIASELERLSGAIAEVERRIAAVKAENPGRLPEDMLMNQRVLERAVDNLRAAERELALAESDASFFRQQLAAADGGGTSDEVASPSRKLKILELELSEYRSRGFTDKHPDIIAAEQEIQALRQRIEAGDEDDDFRDPSQQTAEAEVARAELRVQGARAEISRLQEQILDYERRIGETPRVQEQLAALQREYEHLFASYQEFSAKRLEAGVAANMERRQKGEQFRVLEAAVSPPGPSSPNRPLIVVLGLFLGLAIGGGVGILVEAADTSFHSPRELQNRLRLPVLSGVPSIMLASDLAARRRRRLRTVLATGAIVSVVLLGAIAGNWAVNGVPGPIQELFGAGEQTASVAGEPQS